MLELVYGNIGQKIKRIAFAFFILSLIGTIGYGLYLFSDADHFEEFEWVYPLLGMFGGIISAWIVSCFAYGFGELIEKTAENAETNQSILGLLEEGAPEDEIKRVLAEKFDSCSLCGKKSENLKTFTANSTLGMEDYEVHLCEDCARDHELNNKEAE